MHLMVETKSNIMGSVGGYFDGSGVHWMLSDAIGSVELVIDGKGRVEQHTGYYPYGEPWREPSGQPYLFGGKERRRFASLGDSDFHARFLTTALWQVYTKYAYDGLGNYKTFDNNTEILSVEEFLEKHIMITK